MLPEIIVLIIVGVITAFCLVYSLFAFHEKGPILTNETLLATTEEQVQLERRNPDKKKRDYRFVAIVFLWLSSSFLSMFIGILLLILNVQGTFMFVIAGGLAISLAVFVIIASIRDGEYK